MILTDYFRSQHDLTWDYAKQCGVEYGTIRLPETDDFDITDFNHWKQVMENFTKFGIKPLIIEPLPYELHDHIKAIPCEGNSPRDFNIVDDILICANEQSDNVSFFKIVNGIPQKLNHMLKIKSAFCVSY